MAGLELDQLGTVERPETAGASMAPGRSRYYRDHVPQPYRSVAWRTQSFSPASTYN
jgi:hypothetical protein